MDEVTLDFEGKRLSARRGETLKTVLRREGLSPHRHGSQVLHCPSLGTCGTCALAVEGPLSPPTAVESWRLSFPPHGKGSGLRLACQARLEGDCSARRQAGFWGQG